MSCKSFHTGKPIEQIAIKPISLKKKSKRDRRKKTIATIMPQNNDSLSDETNFPHILVCLGCFYRHIIAVLMFIPSKEVASKNLFTKIFHSYYQGGKGLSYCHCGEGGEKTCFSLLDSSRDKTGTSETINIPHQTIAEVLKDFEYGNPTDQLCK